MAARTQPHSAPLFEIAQCERNELHGLSRILALQGFGPSPTPILAALRGWITRRTKRHAGNANYFNTVREEAVRLCISRANGTPWPSTKRLLDNGDASAIKVKALEASLRLEQEKNQRLRTDLLAANNETARLGELLSIIRKASKLAKA